MGDKMRRRSGLPSLPLNHGIEFVPGLALDVANGVGHIDILKSDGAETESLDKDLHAVTAAARDAFLALDLCRHIVNAIIAAARGVFLVLDMCPHHVLGGVSYCGVFIVWYDYHRYH